MNTGTLIDDALSGEWADARAPTEADFYRIYAKHHMQSRAPVDAAILGGLMADRLPWIFVAGYQAAIRQTFPELRRCGWYAFAASEEKTHASAPIATRLIHEDGEFRLTGAKSWIAQSAIVDFLLITALDEAEEQVCVLAPRDSGGLTLRHREAPRFLAAMSQGFADLTEVEVDARNIFDGARIRRFGWAEPKFVMLAAAAFLLRHSRSFDEDLADEMAALTVAMASYCQEDADLPRLLATLDRRLQWGAANFEKTGGTEQILGWEADKGLLSLYSKRIASRAARRATTEKKGQA